MMKVMINAWNVQKIIRLLIIFNAFMQNCEVIIENGSRRGDATNYLIWCSDTPINRGKRYLWKIK